MDAFYLRDGDGFVGTSSTQGGWHPEHQHGGPVQALLARCVEAVPTLTPMQVTRMTVDMVRPVPIGHRLDVATRVVREGKKIQVVEALLLVGEVEHVRSTFLRLRTAEETGAAVPASTTVDRALPAPDGFEPVYRDLPHSPGFLRAIEMRRFPVPGTPEGVFGYWIRALPPLVEGEETLPLSRLAIAGDFANSIGVLIDHTAVSTINADVSVQVLRSPRSDAVAVVGDTRFALDRGLGISVAELHDAEGVCAVATTSQLVQSR